jgi:hypothetical protein
VGARVRAGGGGAATREGKAASHAGWDRGRTHGEAGGGRTNDRKMTYQVFLVISFFLVVEN